MGHELEPSDALLEKIPRFKELFFELVIMDILNLTFPGRVEAEHKLLKDMFDNKAPKEKDLKVSHRGESLEEEMNACESLAELRKFCSEHDLHFPPEEGIKLDMQIAWDDYVNETTPDKTQ